MRPDNRFEAMDKTALRRALIALHLCPNCRGNLAPVALCDSVEGCARCVETWHLPSVARGEMRP
jgi:hypothetical protein